MSDKTPDYDDDLSLYNEQMKTYARRTPDKNRLVLPDGTTEKTTRTCGAHLIMDIDFDGDVIDYIGHSLEACTLTRVVLGIFIKTAVGMNEQQVRWGYEGFKSWLDGTSDDLPEGWTELQILEPARGYTVRHEAMLLPFTAALDIFDQRGSKTE